jgi:hypothetical protein
MACTFCEGTPFFVVLFLSRQHKTQPISDAPTQSSGLVSLMSIRKTFAFGSLAVR